MIDIKIIDITRSIENRIKDFFSLGYIEDVFVYSDSTIDVSRNFQASVKDEVLANTTSFVIYNFEKPDEFIQEDLVGLNLMDFGFNVRKIISYDKLTGIVVLDNGFDFTLLPTDILPISYGDTLFIRPLYQMNDDTTKYLLTKNIRYKYVISTINDESKEKIMQISSDLSDLFAGSIYPILNSSYDETGEFYYVNEMPTQFSDIENKDAFQSVTGMLSVNFKQKRRRV